MALKYVMFLILVSIFVTGEVKKKKKWISSHTTETNIRCTDCEKCLSCGKWIDCFVSSFDPCQCVCAHKIDGISCKLCEDGCFHVNLVTCECYCI